MNKEAKQTIKGKENELCGLTNEKIEEVHKLYTGFELEKQFTCRYETISYNVWAGWKGGTTLSPNNRNRNRVPTLDGECVSCRYETTNLKLSMKQTFK